MSGLDVVEVVVAVCSEIAGLVSVSAMVDGAVRDDQVRCSIVSSQELNVCVGGAYAYTFSALHSEDPWPMRQGQRILVGNG